MTGTGNRVAAADWKSLSYSMSQIISSRRPTRTVAIHAYKANKAASLTGSRPLTLRGHPRRLTASGVVRRYCLYLRLRPENGLREKQQPGIRERARALAALLWSDPVFVRHPVHEAVQRVHGVVGVADGTRAG